MNRLMTYLHILCMAVILSCRVCCALAQTLVYREVKTFNYSPSSTCLTSVDVTISTCDKEIERRIASYSYDDLGRVDRQTSGSVVQQREYDLHGRPTKLISPHFTEELGYTLSGSVSNMSWWNGDVSTTSRKSYNLLYYGTGELFRAMYSDDASPDDDYSEYLMYDDNGNIDYIERWGYVDDSDEFADIDYLSLSYNGNQLTKVYDEGHDWALTPDFESNSTFATQYTYNPNGSLVSDMNKGIACIEYDHRNYPRCIQFTSGSMIRYLYSAEGKKLQVQYITAVPNLLVPYGSIRELSPSQILGVNTIDYWDHVVCENGELKRYLFDGGYADIGLDSLTFHYYVKDHLGSIRIVQNASGAIEQRNNYYPYGNLFGEYNNCDIGSDLQRYKFNGKEHDMVHGLDLLDFGARMYDSKLGRWHQVDSRLEDYYHVSPYVYCLNDPLSYVDPDGREVYPFDNNSFTAILNTISDQDKEFVVLDENGYIDPNIIQKHTSNSANFTKLQQLVGSDLLFNVYVQSDCPYMDNDGNKKIEYMSYIEIEEDFVDKEFKDVSGLTTGETGKLGVSMLPGKGISGKNSIDNNVHIYVNPLLSEVGQAEILSHELYGHGFLYHIYRDRDISRHHFSETGLEETNLLLRKHIIESRKETILNMMKR